MIAADWRRKKDLQSVVEVCLVIRTRYNNSDVQFLFTPTLDSLCVEIISVFLYNLLLCDGPGCFTWKTWSSSKNSIGHLSLLYYYSIYTLIFQHWFGDSINYSRKKKYNVICPNQFITTFYIIPQKLIKNPSS